MKTKTISYTYDPQMRMLTILQDGKIRGGFIGSNAEKQFYNMLEKEAEINIVMNSEEFKKSLIRRFHAAMATQGIMDHKESILAGYGVEHTTDLSIDQLKELVAHYSTGKQSRDKRADDPAQVRSLRSDLLTICQKMNIYATNDDWTRVNDFFMKHTKKLMFDLTEEELLKARKQFNSLLDWHRKQSNELNRLKQNN
jgi:hypothetical protein